MNSNTVQHAHSLTQVDRANLKQHKSYIIWFTGLSASGKSTVANALEQKLFQAGKHTYLLDGDNVRYGLNRDLKFSAADRTENIRRVGEVAQLFCDAGLIVLVAFISPFKADRDLIRQSCREGEFIEVFVNTPIEVCEKRDPKGLYQQARTGNIKDFTGVDSPYELPEHPEVHITHKLTTDESVDKILCYLNQNKYI
ncbi:MAG: adenylylsulfate kinase [Thiomicrorhabdus sp.]|nr:MAG: adenylylsulfate kinase [Thiomicrorhabdus sp.]